MLKELVTQLLLAASILFNVFINAENMCAHGVAAIVAAVVLHLGLYWNELLLR